MSTRPNPVLQESSAFGQSCFAFPSSASFLSLMMVVTRWLSLPVAASCRK